ncbi:hypothetical protein CPT_Pollock56 [Escherichia phage Pollock]|uniref:Uncharacterized protein n=1 Tax=Escherichia phage Pollock TaxID=1540097 RepID=A0A0A0YW92_9CAUD|nr:hypothetical protein ACQ44_gp56 [Escherichia phage Pollock]AIX12415.1 hypothetical protein CPT_Pollock56 [Escherichia phage Pollock]
MQITLNQDEILEALKNYAFSVINVAPGNDITIDLKAGRGENGYSATLEITPQRKEVKTSNVHTGSTENTVGLRTEVVERTVESDKRVMHEVTPELPVEGVDIIDTEAKDPAADMTEEEVDAEVDAFMATQNPTKSLFARN